jgi:hypothetical protein
MKAPFALRLIALLADHPFTDTAPGIAQPAKAPKATTAARVTFQLCLARRVGTVVSHPLLQPVIPTPNRATHSGHWYRLRST